MGSNIAFLALFLYLNVMQLSSATPEKQDLIAATQEMQRANYFTFVMLINMSPPDTRLQSNLTFLMPNDRMLAKMALQEGSVSSFLLQHSIPSPLLFGTLEKFPTGTTIPSSLPNYMLRITNNGRKNFVLNNVKIISPNICVLGSSIRCHGIDGVLSQADIYVYNSTFTVPPSSSCPNSTETEASCTANSSPPSSSSSSSPPPLGGNLRPPIMAAPTPTEADSGLQKSPSSSHCLSHHPLLTFAASLMLTLAGIYL